MKMETISTWHLVKSEDLNHHGTLYAGRATEWMVEAAFIAASYAVGDEHVVCLRINSLLFMKPVQKGHILTFTSRLVHGGRSSLTVYVEVLNRMTNEFFVDGFFTFVRVDEHGKPMPHNITIEPFGDEEKLLEERVQTLLEAAKAESVKK
ncbi:MAG: acyl-CoA thioesterase [Synergistaceae bacterium]|jgi:acyl-CoA hydrolase|nr:acyl-CoA thioesterase [Synergistaceae bacterium]